ncbi:hypothetical protein BD410DRAFT_840613 [Rickenella mellea]|uniref:Uncharacterized protein n=1 Tax=Rickenella mellea TaxID=50990 RepID=A0A4Y7Q1A2_9AGAM|nr:hypothetical protein BD410DRAFT_840613 [Rickenella mellea]
MTKVQDWREACANIFTSQNLTLGLVDQHGHPTSAFINETWGITYGACISECGSSQIVQAVRFTIFASSFTNWLLPWLAFTSQLPYQASGTGSNVMSGFIAVGSPALVTYSLALTILNRCWIRRIFSRLKRASQEVSDCAPLVKERVIAAGEFLKDAQQAPIRVSQNDGWLSSLIVLPGNQAFWDSMRKNLRKTRRGFSATLLAQVLWASLAYLLTVVSAAIGNFGDEVIGLQIASGSIWLWMLPVILGWIIVGCQCRDGAINSALHDDSDKTYRALPSANPFGDMVVMDKQRGLTSPCGLNLHDFEHPSWLGFAINGDEGREGPIYNYSRVFTWFQCATQIHGAFKEMLLNLCKSSSDRRKVNGSPWGKTGTKDSHDSDSLVGTSLEVAKYCGLTRNINAYPTWSEIPAEAWHNIVYASLIAIFVQWGTTGPAILIAYLTPTVGLGCRSGSFLFYGSAATFSWILIMSSSLFSHAAMLRSQAILTESQEGHDSEAISLNGGASILQKESRSDSGVSVEKLYRPSSNTSFLGALAICTLFSGKFIACLNAVWLVATNIMEYLGYFEMCWCATNALSTGTRGWTETFHNPTPSNYWVAGLLFSLFVCLGSMLFFWFASAESRKD